MALLTGNPWTYVQQTPPATKGWTAATLLFSALYFYLSFGSSVPVDSLALVPETSLFHPWTFFTSALVETSIPELIVTLVFIPASLRYLERLWGSIEILKFIAVCVVVPNLIVAVFSWLLYVVLGGVSFVYGQQYHGQMGLLTAVLVAFTQLIPEHQVQLFGMVKLRVKQLPMAYLTFSTVLCFLGFTNPFILIQFAWLVSYLYLRFYKKNTTDNVGTGVTYGDRSETFAFIGWFPPFTHFAVSKLANASYALATRFHLIPTSAPDVEANGGAYAPPAPGGARAEAERRRAMALKALDQRLAHSAAPPPAPPPAPAAARPPPAAAASRLLNGGPGNAAKSEPIDDGDIGQSR